MLRGALRIVCLSACLISAGCESNQQEAPKDKDVAGFGSEPEFTPEWDRRVFDHGLWDEVLSGLVDHRGMVDYAGISDSAAFREYLHRLGRSDEADLESDNERLAFWINAYNALTIRAVLDTLPGNRADWAEYSIRDQRIGGESIWKGVRFNVGGKVVTLDGIEHEVIRGRDGLRDPRIHVALVCGARGCPPLWNRAYTGPDIRKQLQMAMDRFLSNPRQFSVDLGARTIRISKVFEWYGADFTDPKFKPRADSIPAFLSDAAKSPDLKSALKTGSWDLEYFKYDWKLNLKQ